MTLQASCGNILARDISSVAANCARSICELQRKGAVMLSAKGIVTVETGVDPLDADFVGMYCPSSGELELWRLIGEDLMFELSTRTFAPIKRVR